MADLSLDLTATSNTFQDLLVVNGDLIMTSDLQAGGTDPVLQDILQTIRWITGEWFLDIFGGTPWFQDIFIKNPDQDKIDSILRATIENVPGVVALTQFSVTPVPASRSLTVQFSAQKTTGTISYSGNLDF